MARNSQDDLRHLGVDFPGVDLVSIPPNESKGKKIDPDHPWDKTDLGPYGCVTAYAQVRKGPSPTGVVRFNLFAELMGMRSLVGSAFVTPGTSAGVIITATGIVADSWTLSGQASAPALTVKAGLISSRGCAEPAVRIPSAFRNVPLATPPQMSTGSPNPGPLELESGQAEVYSLEAPPFATVLPLDVGERVTAIYAASGLGGGSFGIRFPDEGVRTVFVDGVFGGYLSPVPLLGASLVNVDFVNFDNINAFQVYTVR